MTATVIVRPKRRVIRLKRSYSPTGRVGRVLIKVARLQRQYKALEKELQKYKPSILRHMLKIKRETISLENVVEIQQKCRHNWTYSPKTEKFALKLRMLQEFEQQQGIATDNPSYYIAIIPKGDA